MEINRLVVVARSCLQVHVIVGLSHHLYSIDFMHNSLSNIFVSFHYIILRNICCHTGFFKLFNLLKIGVSILVTAFIDVLKRTDKYYNISQKTLQIFIYSIVT